MSTPRLREELQDLTYAYVDMNQAEPLQTQQPEPQQEHINQHQQLQIQHPQGQIQQIQEQHEAQQRQDQTEALHQAVGRICARCIGKVVFLSSGMGF